MQLRLRLTLNHVAFMRRRFTFTHGQKLGLHLWVNVNIWNLFFASCSSTPSHLFLFSPQIKTSHHDVFSVDWYDFVFAVTFRSFVFFYFLTCWEVFSVLVAPPVCLLRICGSTCLDLWLHIGSLILDNVSFCI